MPSRRGGGTIRQRVYYLLGTVLLIAFAGFSFSSFKDTLTPYVSYDEARALERTVQVAGALEKGSARYDETTEALTFALRDSASKATIRIRYHGLKPANFEDAISIVAIGRYDPAAEALVADKLLVKCPSKYQGAEVTKSYS